MAEAADEPGPGTLRGPFTHEPPAGQAIELPEPLPRPAPPRWPGVLKRAVVGLGIAALLAGGFTWSWWANRLPYPSRDQLQARTAASIGLRERTTVAARCAEPDQDGARCLLRDREGRYGYSITTFRVDHGGEGPGRLVQSTSWDFPLDAQARLEERFEVKPPWDLASSISRAVLLATYALGRADLGTTVSCPEVRPGTTVTCTASGQVTGAQLQQVDATHFLLTAGFTPPAGAVTPPR